MRSSEKDGGKEWAKEWLKERTLLSFAPDRELIALMTALDTLLFGDAHSDFINHMGTERLAKRALGLFKASENVKSEADRRRPANAGCGW